MPEAHRYTLFDYTPISFDYFEQIRELAALDRAPKTIHLQIKPGRFRAPIFIVTHFVTQITR